MQDHILFCLDSRRCTDPQVLGISKNQLESKETLHIASSSQAARTYAIETDSLTEIWVASADDMDAINLAAALKKSCMDVSVSLLAFSGGGAIRSNARAAGIDYSLSQYDFLAKFNALKNDASANEQAATKPSLKLDYVKNPAVLSDVNCEGPFAESSNFENNPSVQRAETGNKNASIISVIGSSGGCGKSTISVLAASVLQQRGCKTLLIDADLQFGDAALLSGVKTPISLDEYMADCGLLTQSQASPGILPQTTGVGTGQNHGLGSGQNRGLGTGQHSGESGCLDLICAPKYAETAEVLTSKVVPAIETLRSKYDLIILNTGSSWSDLQIELIELSSAVLFMVDQRTSSIKASKQALDLCLRCGIATKHFNFILNKCSRKANYTIEDVSFALGGLPVFELADGGREVADMLGAGLAAELAAEENPLIIDLTDLLRLALPNYFTDDPKVGKSLGLSLASLFKKAKVNRSAACL